MQYLNPVPCMLYCGPELCNCVARIFYETEEEWVEDDDYYIEEDKWLTQDKKAHEEKKRYDRYYAAVQDLISREPQEVAQVALKAISTSQDVKTTSVLK